MKRANHSSTKTAPVEKVFLSVVLCAFLFASCSREEVFEQDESGTWSDLISFGMTLPEGWNAFSGTRSGGSDIGYVMLPSYTKTVEVGETPDGQKLQISMTVTEGIVDESPEEKLEEVPETDDGSTRASTPLPENDRLNLGIFAYLTDRDVDAPEPEYDGSVTSQFMHNTLVDVSEDYAYTPVKYWPGDAYWLKFFAYRPYMSVVNARKPASSDHNYLTVDDDTSPGNPILHYTVPPEAAYQADLLAVDTDMIEGDYCQTVNLPFRHLLSAINFKVDSMPEATIKSIGLLDVRKNGVYSDWSAAGMSAADDERDIFGQNFLIGPNGTEVPGLDATANAGKQLGYTFYMIPQSFAADDNARLGIRLAFINRNDDNEVLGTNNYDIERPLKDFVTSWEPNKTYTYTLSTPREVSLLIDDKVSEDGKVKSDLVIKNNGLATVYIRVSIIGAWVKYNDAGEPYSVATWEEDDGVFDWGDANGNAEPTTTATTGWRKGTGEDSYYYYLKPVERNEEIPIPLFESYTLTAKAPYPDAELMLIIAGQAVIHDDIFVNIGTPETPAYIWPDEIVGILRP